MGALFEGVGLDMVVRTYLRERCVGAVKAEELDGKSLADCLEKKTGSCCEKRGEKK